MGAEHDGDLVALLLWVSVKNSLDAVGECFDEQRVGRPSVDERPRDITFWCATLLAPLDLTVELVQVTTSSTAAVLGVLSEADSAGNTVLSHLVESLFSQRSSIAESDIDLVRRCLGVKLVEQLCHGLSLRPGPAQDGRTATNLFILIDDLGRPPACNEGSKAGLEWELDELSIVKQAREEITNFLGSRRGGPTHVHEKDTGGWLGRVLGDSGERSLERSRSSKLDRRRGSVYQPGAAGADQQTS